MVEHSAVNRVVVGSSPTRGAISGPIAQLVELPAHNRSVPGSSPGGPTNFIAIMAPWSSGLRHRPFTAVTRVRIPVGSPNIAVCRKVRQIHQNLVRKTGGFFHVVWNPKKRKPSRVAGLCMDQSSFIAVPATTPATKTIGTDRARICMGSRGNTVSIQP